MTVAELTLPISPMVGELRESTNDSSSSNSVSSTNSTVTQRVSNDVLPIGNNRDAGRVGLVV